MSRSLRYPRIAFSVVCGILCLLFVGLWARSYQWIDSFHVQIGYARSLDFRSDRGLFIVSEGYDLWYKDAAVGAYRFHSGKAPQPESEHEQISKVVETTFTCRLVLDDLLILWPDWVIAVIPIVIASLAWIDWRFSLRSLLIFRYHPVLSVKVPE